MISENDFNFTQKEIEVLFWIKYWGAYDDCDNQNLGFFSRVLGGEEKINNKKQDIYDKKRQWFNEWHEITAKLLNIDKKIKSKELLIEFKKLNLSKGKKLAFIVEISTFTPYFNLKENGFRYDKLDFDTDNYFDSVSKKLNTRTSHFSSSRSAFETGIKLITKDISGSNNTWLWVGIGAAVLLLVAPYLAGTIGGIMGLSGAAATSAGLAFLGGGSLAAGGFGMAGGYVAVMAGGALIGYKSGNSSYQSKVKESTKEDILLSSAKMVAVLSLIENPKESIIMSCDSARQLQNDFETDADFNFIHNKPIEGANSAKKAAILVSFRGIIRSSKLKT